MRAFTQGNCRVLLLLATYDEKHSLHIEQCDLKKGIGPVDDGG